MRAGEPLHLVRCLQCDRRYYVGDGDQPLPEGWGSGREATRHFLPTKHLAMQRPAAVQQLVDAVGQVTKADERRQHQRVQVALHLLVAPLDSDFRPLDVAQDAASIDISAGGVSFLVRSQRSAGFWLVDFGQTAGAGQQAIIKLARMQPNDPHTWTVAGVFVSHLDIPDQSKRIIYANRRI